MAAAAYQAYGLRTILVEFDLERPSLARRLGVESKPGVAEILRDGASIEECLHMPDDEAVGVLVAGDASSDPAGLLSILGRSSLVRDLGGLFEVVVADLPPLSPAGQGSPLAPQFETTFLVVRSGLAPVGDIRRAVDDLAKPPPVIFNGVETSIPKPLRALLAG
jgi:Mrp family chromosome partitioning ATPase